MQDLNDKVTGGNLSAAEWNEVPSEIQNVIEGLGQSLSGGDLNQLGKGIAGYVVNGDFGADSGAADAYVITVIGGKQVPTAYTDGFKVSFRVGNTNTGASTVNAYALGVKTIFYNGGALVGGELTVGLIVNLVYDLANGRFDLVPNLSGFIENDQGWVIGSPGAGSLGAGTLNVENQIAIGASADSGIPFFIETAFAEQIRLRSTSVTGNLVITFYQTTTERARIRYEDANDTLNIISNYGRISFLNDSAGTAALRAYFDPDGGMVIGAPGAGSLGAGTLNVENQIGIGVSADAGIPLHIEAGSGEQLRLQSTSAGGNIEIRFYQTTTRRAFINFIDGNNDLQLISEYGRVSFWNDSAAAETLSAYFDPDGGQVNGAPTGASKGAGTGNFENGVYTDGQKVAVEHGTFTTSSLGSSTAESVNVPHSLGTDNVVVLIMGEGSVDVEQWSSIITRPDGKVIASFGSAPSPTAVNVPATGNINIYVFNTDGATQTVTIAYTIFARD